MDATEAALLEAFSPTAEDAEALGLTQLVPDAYDELRRLAASYLRRERSNHTLQPTALVHEAYLRLRNQSAMQWRNRGQFLGIAAKMMRRILVNHAIARSANKRGADSVHVHFDEALEFYNERELNLVAVDDALKRLEQLDKRQARIVELRFFGGLTVEEIAEVLQIAPVTVKREWSTAKLWLQRELADVR